MGYKIKERREALRMSQEELASKSGVSRQTISSIENCPDKNMSTKTLEKIAAALGTTLKDLFLAKASKVLDKRKEGWHE